MDKVEFERCFRQYLNNSLFNQSSLARQLGVERTTVHKWITTENHIPYERLNAICEHLNVPKMERARFFELAGYTQVTPSPSSADAPAEKEAETSIQRADVPGREHDVTLYTEVGNIKRPAKLFGRKPVLQHIYTLLDQGKHVLLTGLGGSGKTALAATIADARMAAGSDRIIWIGARGEDTDSILDALVVELHAQEEIIAKRADAKIKAVQDILAKAAVSLVVLDDVWNHRLINLVRTAMPRNVPLLMTSRIDSANVDASIPVVALDPSESAALLQYHMRGRGEVAPGHQKDDSVSYAPTAATESLCATLGHLPLGIVIAGAWLKQNNRQPDELLQRIIASSLTPFTIPIPRSFADEGRETLKEVFDQTYSDLEAPLKRAFRIFGYLAEPQASSTLLAAYLETNRWDAETLLDELVHWNLLQRNRANVYSMHDMVHDYAKMVLPQHREEAAAQIIDATAHYVLRNKDDFALLHADLPNILHVAERADIQTQVAIVAPLALGGYLDNEGHSAAFLRILDQVIEHVRLHHEGGLHDYETDLLHNLLSKRGNAYFDRGEYGQAANAYGAAREVARSTLRTVMLTALIGKAFSFDQQFQDGQSYLQNAEAAAREAKNDLLLSFVLEQQAHVAGYSEDFAAAYRIANEQVRINERLLAESNDRDRNERLFRSLTNLGTAKIRLTQTEKEAAPRLEESLAEALAIHQRAAEIALNLESAELQAHAYWALGEDYHLLQECARAGHYLCQAHQLFQEQGKFRDQEIVANFIRMHGYPLQNDDATEK